MNVVTVNVGQGALSIIRHNHEAIVVDCRIPPTSDTTVAFVKQMFATSLKDHRVKGLVLTGFDDDHTDVAGTAIVLQKYRPDWVLYPQYYKDTKEAKSVFWLIDREEKARQGTANPLRRISVRLDKLSNRKLPGTLREFRFRTFFSAYRGHGLFQQLQHRSQGHRCWLGGLLLLDHRRYRSRTLAKHRAILL